MSMGIGGGDFRPNTIPGQPVQRPQDPSRGPSQGRVDQPNQQPSQTGRQRHAGPLLHSVNQFNPQAVNPELEQLHGWLTSLKSQSPGAAASPPPTLQNAQKERNIPSPQQAAPRPRMERNSEDKLHTHLESGYRQLGKAMGIPARQVAHLAQAKASGNGAHYLTVMEKIGMPKGSPGAREMAAGLNNIFKASNASFSKIAEQTAKGMALNNINKQAQKAGIPLATAQDLSKMLHLGRNQFLASAQNMGVPREQADMLLRAIKKTGRRFDFPPMEMQKMASRASRENDLKLQQMMKQESDKLDIPEKRYLAMGNALMNGDKERYQSLGTGADLRPEQLARMEADIHGKFKKLEQNPAIGGEKMIRMEMDDRTKDRIIAAGEELGIPQKESLHLAYTYTEEGPESVQMYGQKAGLADEQIGNFLNQIEEISEQVSDTLVFRSLSSEQDIFKQQMMAMEMGFTEPAANWSTTDQEIGFSFTEDGQPDFDQLMEERLMETYGLEDISEVRHSMMSDQIAQYEQEIERFDDVQSQFITPGMSDQADQYLAQLMEQRDMMVSARTSMEQVQPPPPPELSAELKLQAQADRLQQKMDRLSTLVSNNPAAAAIHQPALQALASSLQTMYEQLNARKN